MSVIGRITASLTLATVAVACGGEATPSSALDCAGGYPLCSETIGSTTGPSSPSTIAISGMFEGAPFEETCDFSLPGPETNAYFCRRETPLPQPDLLDISCTLPSGALLRNVQLYFSGLSQPGTYLREEPWPYDDSLPLFGMSLRFRTFVSLATVYTDLVQQVLVLDNYDLCAHTIRGSIDVSWDARPGYTSGPSSAQASFDVAF